MHFWYLSLLSSFYMYARIHILLGLVFEQKPNLLNCDDADFSDTIYHSQGMCF